MKAKRMNVHPFLIKPIIDGTKTQIRKVVAPKRLTSKEQDQVNPLANPKYKVGDVFWIPERWKHNPIPSGWPYFYYIDAEEYLSKKEDEIWNDPSTMKIEYARLFIKVMEVRVERLHSISTEDAIAEGVKKTNSDWGIDEYEIYTAKNCWDESPIQSFKSIWQLAKGMQSWACNPWVYVLRFERIESPLNANILI